MLKAFNPFQNSEIFKHLHEVRSLKTTKLINVNKIIKLFFNKWTFSPLPAPGEKSPLLHLVERILLSFLNQPPHLQVAVLQVPVHHHVQPERLLVVPVQVSQVPVFPHVPLDLVATATVDEEAGLVGVAVAGGDEDEVNGHTAFL